MPTLNGATDSLELQTDNAVSTDWSVEWTDLADSDGSATAGSAQGNTAAAGTLTMVAAPAGGHTRILRGCTIRNRDAAAAQVVTVKKDVSATERHLTPAVTLQAGECLEYRPEQGWTPLDAGGRAKVASGSSQAPPTVLVSPIFSSAGLTSVKSLTNTTAFAVYVGKAPRALTQAQVRLRVTTAEITVVASEVAIAKGAIVVGGNPILTVVGTLSTATIWTSLGQYTHTVPVAVGQQIAEGDDLWVVLYGNATTPTVVRGVSIADDLQVGLQGSRATSLPSSRVGLADTYTIEGATTLAAWVALLC